MRSSAVPPRRRRRRRRSPTVALLLLASPSSPAARSLFPFRRFFGVGGPIAAGLAVPAPVAVEGWSPPRPRPSIPRTRLPRRGGTRRRSSPLISGIASSVEGDGRRDDVVAESSRRTGALGVRGGGGEGDDEEVAATDDPEASSDANGDGDELNELRRTWAEVTPAAPTIAWPISDDDDVASMGDAPGATLADVASTGGSADGAKTKALIVVDGFSPYHGEYLSHIARRVHGAAVIHVLSDFMTRYLLQVRGSADHLASRLPNLDDPEDVARWRALLPASLEVRGIYCESDAGLDDAERLGVALGLHPRWHDGVDPARRDKFLMNEALSKAGLDTVKQRSCATSEEAAEFARGLGLPEEREGGEEEASAGVMVVAKPPRGVASDDVFLCRSLSELREAFAKIQNSPVFGSAVAAKHATALVQEFARGTEYAVDVVCRNGERKAAAVWRYDKGPANGAPFVYHATELVSAAEGVEEEACEYAFAALEALGVRWGLSHVEVIAEATAAPEGGSEGKEMARIRLVEVNCRQHNTDFAPLTNACVGYNALDLTLAAYLDDDDDGDDDNDNNNNARGRLRWTSVPTLPTTRARGSVVHFVSHVEGTLSKIRYDALREIEDLPSVADVLVYPQFLEVGNRVGKTVDIRTDAGWAHLMNDDDEEFARDYERIVELMRDAFEVEEASDEG